MFMQTGFSMSTGKNSRINVLAIAQCDSGVDETITPSQ